MPPAGHSLAFGLGEAAAWRVEGVLHGLSVSAEGCIAACCEDDAPEVSSELWASLLSAIATKAAERVTRETESRQPGGARRRRLDQR